MSHNHKKVPAHIKNFKDVEIFESPIHRFGLFATKDIPKGTLLGTLTGQIVSSKDYFDLMRAYPKECFIEKIHLDDDYILAIPFRTHYSFINHSNTEEMIYIKEIYEYAFSVYAAIDIPNNKEITSIYNLEKHIDILGGFNDK
jgi:SET domain-containing protein